MPQLVAFIGYSRTGKDTAASVLIQRGWERINFADFIKSEIDPLIKQYFGFSAFTEVDAEKKRIRRVLEEWGHSRYEQIFKQFERVVTDTLAEGRSVVNTKLVRPEEAERWLEMGGKIIHIEKPGVGPATEWEANEFEKLLIWLKDRNISYTHICNGESIEFLRSEVEYELGLKN